MRRLKEENLDDPVSAELIEDYFLRNRHGKGDLSYKMLLTRTDKDTLVALLDGKEPSEPVSFRITDNFEFFSVQMVTADLKVVYQGIQKLMIVDVRLQHGLDNPQMIFESMNSTGKALTQADLIRNFVLMGLSHDLQTRLYNDYWRPMEIEFGAEGYSRQFDEFMRFFLVVQIGNHRIRKDDVYNEFRSYSRKHEVEALLGDLMRFARFYCAIALGNEKDPELAQAFHNIRELRADVCYPLLMELYSDLALQRLSKAEFIEILQMVESYVFRRAVCDIPTNSLRQTFATFARKLKKDRYLESVRALFLLLPSYRRFPNDEEFMRLIQVRNLYAFNRRSYWLRRFETYNKKEHVFVQDYTIEHIMPQNENLNAQWLADLGEDWQSIHTQYLHTLGNLTLTGYNSEYSDLPFQEKRDMENGFKDSPLRLNQGLGAIEVWNEETIKKRAERLAKRAAEIWTAPTLDAAILQEYRSEGSSQAQYQIEDHPNLAGGITRDLFDVFRTEVLSLDECVREEVLKFYIAFKAETNFVDVVPQAKRLRLSLNMGFPELDDPRGICKDVSGVGRWGNGDVEVFLEKAEDIPYVLGLVRQALESQLGEDDVES